jgi:hypothetical protein
VEWARAPFVSLSVFISGALTLLAVSDDMVVVL